MERRGFADVAEGLYKEALAVDVGDAETAYLYGKMLAAQVRGTPMLLLLLLLSTSKPVLQRQEHGRPTQSQTRNSPIGETPAIYLPTGE